MLDLTASWCSTCFEFRYDVIDRAIVLIITTTDWVYFELRYTISAYDHFLCIDRSDVLAVRTVGHIAQNRRVRSHRIVGNEPEMN